MGRLDLVSRNTTSCKAVVNHHSQGVGVDAVKFRTTPHHRALSCGSSQPHLPLRAAAGLASISCFCPVEDAMYKMESNTSNFWG